MKNAKRFNSSHLIAAIGIVLVLIGAAVVVNGTLFNIPKNVVTSTQELKENLKDPESLIVKGDVIYTEAANDVGLYLYHISAKNGFGGYEDLYVIVCETKNGFFIKKDSNGDLYLYYDEFVKVFGTEISKGKYQMDNDIAEFYDGEKVMGKLK